MSSPFNIKNKGRKNIALTVALRTTAGDLVRSIPPNANLLLDHASVVDNARELASLVKLGHIDATPAIPKPVEKPKAKPVDTTAVELAALKEAFDKLRREVISANAELDKVKSDLAKLKERPKQVVADPDVPPPPKPPAKSS